MSKIRKINGIIAIAIAVVLVTMVIYYWKQLGCDVKSLAVAGVSYPAVIAGMWAAVDNQIKEWEAEL